MVKFFAVGLILFSCGAMGILIARSFAQRVHNLRELIRLVQILESEIQFARTTLPTVISAQAQQFSGEVGEFLHTLDTKLKAGTGESFSLIWCEGLSTLAKNGLPPFALEDLQNLGPVLGTSDAREQSKHLGALLRRLEQALSQAREECQKQSRLWLYLGFSAGLLIVLLLL
ncbi:MAG: stage III sporulation protein AB [Bacillota bacterium]|nr:stage III sporulation protein AB [Bacillota bacterium]HHT91371.1 hypothetical protein [Bacillota bacterium]